MFKNKGMGIIIQLEQRYTKNEIIAMYLNIYDFGYNADGVRSAARFFDTFPDALLLEQSATLVGMLKTLHCIIHLDVLKIVRERRNVVFQQMYRNKMISKDEKFS